MNKILFITTSSLASNPRLVKEFEALKSDYDCHVLCFKHHDWSSELSEAIITRNPDVQFIEIDRKKAVFQTLKSKLAHKAAILYNSKAPQNFKICAFANNDKALQLSDTAQMLSEKTNYSRIVAHNLGAFYAAVKLSEQKGIALQLDIEDYYPGEALYFNEHLEKQNRMHLMAESFAKAQAITYASKGIQLECEKHFKVPDGTKQETIINAFHATDFVEPKENSSERIKAVWFSQHIGPNRGLEQVFDAAKSYEHIEFHLIGNKNKDYLKTFSFDENVIFHDIMQQEALHEFLSRMDIGLALENVKADLNRDICLTNKFLAYAQAGLYIVATDTFGQTQFMNSLDYESGVIISKTLIESLVEIDEKQIAIERKKHRWNKAKLFAWENEQLKLKRLLA
ncbi:glycosyltransferase family protein [Gelidibacter gilvus]|uniref:Glycosyltransferase n=1 Tax=Gelidibacter gilvus TaxID=59602 RepID=A0A4Q0XG29_9FLAO|nr:hypothetical protein [Gelidibacter gilvus]RXJ46044.1 hypothetical protein ESZ48_13195 [Gelidibacter gilvus]